MAQTINQRWEVYEYSYVRDKIPNDGELVVVKNAPGYERILLTGDGVQTIARLVTAAEVSVDLSRIANLQQNNLAWEGDWTFSPDGVLSQPRTKNFANRVITIPVDKTQSNVGFIDWLPANADWPTITGLGTTPDITGGRNITIPDWTAIIGRHTRGGNQNDFTLYALNYAQSNPDRLLRPGDVFLCSGSGDKRVESEPRRLVLGNGQVIGGDVELRGGTLYAPHAEGYTFVVDSDAKLAAWADNEPGNDYSRILIKAGTWIYEFAASLGTENDPEPVIDLSDGRTLSVTGESGGKIIIGLRAEGGGYPFAAGIKGNVRSGGPNLENPGRDYFFKNVTVEIRGSDTRNYGFYGCANLSGCTGLGGVFTYYSFNNCVNLDNCTGGGGIAGFNNCANLINCGGGGVGKGSLIAAGFSRCVNLINCTGDGDGAREDASAASFEAHGFYGCASLINCTGTGKNGMYLSFGFCNCRAGFGCKSEDGFLSCYMERESGSTPWGDTAEGGYNEGQGAG